MPFSNHKKALIALIIANIIWGAAPPIYKWSLSNVEPFTLAFLRFAIASVIIFFFVRKDLGIQKKDIKNILLLGITLTIHIGLLNLSLLKTASINVPIIGSAAPIFLMFSSFFILKEKIRLKKILGALVGFMGVMTILLFPTIEKGFNGVFLGNIMLVVSTICSVIYTIIIKEIAGRYKPLLLVFWTFVISTIFFVPFFFYEVTSLSSLQNLTLQGVTGILYASFFASILAYGCYYFAIKYLQVSDVGIFTYLDPVITVLIAIPLLSEIPTIEYGIGSVLVFTGIYIAENRLHYHPLHLLKKK